MTVHEPVIVRLHGAYPLYQWGCSCGAFDLVLSRSKKKARLEYERIHRHPEAFADAPTHTYSQTDGEFGGPAWVCSCGVQSRPEGYENVRRAQQSHTAHKTKALLLWLDALHGKAARPTTERTRQWGALPDKVREDSVRDILNHLL